MSEMLNIFLPIEKVDDEQRMVWGFASTPTRDLDDEIVKVEAIKEALPDYMQWANIREMHQPKAVGVTTEANVSKAGLYIGAHIVDNDAWEKVKKKVYKGFSIGGRVINKVDDTITKLRMTEISLVDRPANPDAKIDVIKAAGLKGADLNGEERSFLGRLMQKLTGSNSLAKDYNPDESRDQHGEWTSGGQGPSKGPQVVTVGRSPSLSNHPLIWALGATALGAEIAVLGGAVVAGALTAAAGWGVYMAQKLLAERIKAAGDGKSAIDAIRDMAPEEIARRADKLPEEEKERFAHLLAMHMSREQVQEAYDKHGPGKPKEDVAEADDLTKWEEDKHPRGEHGRFGDSPTFGPGGAFTHELTRPSGHISGNTAAFPPGMGSQRVQGALEGAVRGGGAAIPIGASVAAIGHPEAFPGIIGTGAVVGAVIGARDPGLMHRVPGTGDDWDSEHRVEHGPPADLAEGDGGESEDQKAAGVTEHEAGLLKRLYNKVFGKKTVAQLAATPDDRIVEVMDALAKGESDDEFGVRRISAAYDIIRSAQEAMAADDEQNASKLADIASDLAGVIVEKSNREASLAIDLEGDLDQSWSKLDDEGELSMSAGAEDLAKRTSAAHKMSIMKAAEHMAKADDCHAQGMQVLQKCHGMMSKAASKAEVMDMVKKAHGCFAKGSEHMDIAQHHIEKVASSFGSWGGKDGSLPTSVGGGIEENSQSKMTEGKVPEYPDDGEAYPGKAAKMITVEQAEALQKSAVEAATAKAQLEAANKTIETLSKLPAGPARARAFSMGKQFAPLGGEDGASVSGTKERDPMALLTKGVDVYDMEDPDQRQKASARMFGNMIINADTFAKSIGDPSFRGGAQKRAAA